MLLSEANHRFERFDHDVFQLFVDHRLLPEVALAVLHPLEVGSGDAARVGQDVGHHENVLVGEDFVRYRRSRAIGALHQDLRLHFVGVERGDDGFGGRRHQHIAVSNQQLLRVGSLRTLETVDGAFLLAILGERGDVDPIAVVEAAIPLADADDFVTSLMHQAGYKVIGIGEWDGGLYNSNGIDIAALTEYRQKEGTIHGFKGAEAADTEQLLITDCDMLVPAATEAVITSLNADKVKAKILVEGANGPTTAVADEILADKHVFVMPDILANAGGVTASYFEWVQDRQGYFWKESVVNEQLKDIMVESFEAVVSFAEKHRVNNRIAAYMLAIDRVAFTIRQRGIYA